jgi:hypothetical protein
MDEISAKSIQINQFKSIQINIARLHTFFVDMRFLRWAYSFSGMAIA